MGSWWLAGGRKPLSVAVATKSSSMPLPAFFGGYTEPKGRPMVIAVTGRLGGNELPISGSKDDANGHAHRQRGALSMFGGPPVQITLISTGIQVRELPRGEQRYLSMFHLAVYCD